MINDVSKAVDFLKMARADWEAGMASSVPYSICFHAQQAAEKYLKAFLAYHRNPIPKTHDVADLTFRCAAIDPSFSHLLEQAGLLQRFGVGIRYSPSKEEAEQKCSDAWSAMTTIQEKINGILPESDNLDVQ